ncbi:MAG: ATP-binding cassette domain-containing protein, partial [Bacteroidota bacterium]
MIVCQNLQYSIDNKILLKNINCDFQPGKINLLIGPNGAGKSTWIKLLCRQIVPEKGEIEFAGQPIKDFNTKEMAKIRAVLSQNIDLAFPMLVEEVVMMGRYPHFEGRPTKRDYQACREAMELFG